MKGRKNKMNLQTPNEIIELGKVLMIWGGTIFLVGATMCIIGYIYKDLLFTIINEIMDRI